MPNLNYGETEIGQIKRTFGFDLHFKCHQVTNYFHLSFFFFYFYHERSIVGEEEKNKFISDYSPGKGFSSILVTIIKYLGSWKEKEMRRKKRYGGGNNELLKACFCFMNAILLIPLACHHHPLEFLKCILLSSYIIPIT